MSSSLTFVTVVFETETHLLELQARSMSLHLDAEDVDEILVLDNCVLGMGGWIRRRLLRAYGRLQGRVRIVRTTSVIDPRAAGGWRSQQAAKLAIASQVKTPHYVVLDAKNHFTRPTSANEFVGPDGRAHGRSHSYQSHPLRASLLATLEYVHAGPDVIDRAVEAFPPTATPFVFDTAAVRELILDLEERAGLPFGEEFERHKLLEFFLYSAWNETRGPGLRELRDEVPIPSPTVWPKAASEDGVRSAIDEHARDDAAVFAVHRQALAKADAAALDLIAMQWVAFGLFTHADAARAFIRRFRRLYLPSLVWVRGAERARRSLQRWRARSLSAARADSVQGNRAPSRTSPDARPETSAI